MRVPLAFLIITYSLATANDCIQVSIRSGDTCYKLWTDNGMTEESFQAANPFLNCQNLQLGQTVCVIPDPLLPGQYRDDPNNSTCRKLYSIKSGDTCQALWLSNSLNQTTFMSSNPGINCQNLQVAQKVCLNGYLPATNSHQYDPYRSTTSNGINSRTNPTPSPSLTTPIAYYDPYSTSVPSIGGNIPQNNNSTSYIPPAQYQQTQYSPQASQQSPVQPLSVSSVPYQQSQTRTQGQQVLYQPQQQVQSSQQPQQILRDPSPIQSQSETQQDQNRKTQYQPQAQQYQYQPQAQQSHYQPQAQPAQNQPTVQSYQYQPQVQQSQYQPQTQQPQYQPQAQQSQYQPQIQQSQYQPLTPQSQYQPQALQSQYQPQIQQSQYQPQTSQSQHQPQAQQSQYQPQTQQFQNQPTVQSPQYQPQPQQLQYQPQPQQSQVPSQSFQYQPQTQQSVPKLQQYQQQPAQYQYSAPNAQVQTSQPNSMLQYGAPVAQYQTSYQPSLGQSAQTQTFRPLYDSSMDTTVNETCRIHTIKLGDTCFDIWSANGMTQAEFTHLNPSVNCQALQLGQQVCTDPNALRPGQFRDDSSCQKLYSIQAGDTCAALWQTNGISEQYFMQRNAGINCRNLQIGQDICLS